MLLRGGGKLRVVLLNRGARECAGLVGLSGRCMCGDGGCFGGCSVFDVVSSEVGNDGGVGVG